VLSQLDAGPEGAENQRGKYPPPDSDPFSSVEFYKNPGCVSSQFAALADRQFKFQKRGQLLIGMHNETLSVVAICIRNEDRPSRTIHSCNTAPAPMLESGMSDYYLIFRPL